MKSFIDENNELKLTYKLEEGMDESHGVEVAKIAGFDKSIIDEAEEWMKLRKINTTNDEIVNDE